MYEIGQLIVYGNEGRLPRGEEIGTPKISGVDKLTAITITLAPILPRGERCSRPWTAKVFCAR